ncbi:MAG: branched-chain amino acid ABC transporter permease [Desulfobacteraceae bacterium]|nr:branched-chain amino acid ABC transporter permease [Desulfobacteraceae bacterium]
MSSTNNPAPKWLFPLVLSFIIIILAAVIPRFLPPYTIISLNDIFMYIVLTVSWAVFSGPTRYISLASAAFFGIGIYVSAVLGNVLPFLAAIALGGLASFLLALLVGLSSLRLRGMYFTIFTFGLSELIRHSVLWWEVNITRTVGRLVVSVDNITVYYAMLTIVLLTLAMAYFIKNSKYGLALLAIGESEEATDHIGVNVNALKILAFAMSAVFMGAAGATMATRWTYIDPSIAFNPLFSFMPVLMAIFGGVHRIYGQIIGATALTLLADMLLTKFPYYYNLLYGIILVAVILFLPQGLAGLRERMSKWRKHVLVK